MTPLKERLAKLREIAEKASQGEWKSFENGAWGSRGYGVSFQGERSDEWVATGEECTDPKNVLFIAAWSPASALKVLDALERAIKSAEDAIDLTHLADHAWEEEDYSRREDCKQALADISAMLGEE